MTFFIFFLVSDLIVLSIIFFLIKIKFKTIFKSLITTIVTYVFIGLLTAIGIILTQSPKTYNPWDLSESFTVIISWPGSIIIFLSFK